MGHGGRRPAPLVPGVLVALLSFVAAACGTTTGTAVPATSPTAAVADGAVDGDGDSDVDGDGDEPAASSTDPGSPAAPPVVTGWAAAGRFDETLGTEVSGIAAGRAVSGLWIVDDEPGTRDVHLVALDGELRATLRLDGVTTTNPEDLAVGPCPADAATSCVHVADIGDNVAARSEVLVLSVPEEAVDDAPGGEAVVAPTVRRLRYEDGPRDAEALVVLADGTVVVIDKGEDVAGVHVARPGEEVLRRVADWMLPPPPSPGLATFVGHTVTAADVSADGTLLAVRTYDQVLLLRPPGGTVDVADLATLDAWAVTEGRGPPAELQGEAVAVLGDGRVASVGEGTTRISVTTPAPGG